MSAYQSKIDQALAVIAEHNANAPTKVDAAKFLECLKNSGGTTESALGFCKYEDLVACGLPKILATQVAEGIFRKPVTPPTLSPTNNKFVSEKKVGSLTIQQLVEAYDPVEFDNPVGKRLSEIVKGQPCIAFDQNGGVLVTISAKEVKALREGFEARSHVTVNGVPTKLLRIGERPGNLLDENPLYPGRPLRDGECDQTNRSWDGISDTVRTLVHLAVTRTGEISMDHISAAHEVLDKLVGKPGDEVEKFARSRWQKASLLFDELKAQNKLPSLKIARGNSVRKNDPFAHKTY